MVVVGTGSIGSQYLSRDYPAVEGTTAGTTDNSQLTDLEEQGL